MNNGQRHHVLFSVTGTTPAVITETLYGLTQQGVSGGDVHILTTSRGRRDMQVLLEEDGRIAAFNRAYETRWQARYDWIEAITGDPPSYGLPLGRGAMPLDDLRTTADNTAAANRIVERVRDWTAREDVVLHASVAGGRKTMGLFLTQAMSWFARPDDDLSHVLVADGFENRTFFFPDPDNPQHQGVVDFALLPFVRMRGLLPPLFDHGGSYSGLVRLSQVYLEDAIEREGKLTLGLTDGRLAISGFEVARLQPLSVGLYLYLWQHANRARNQDPFYLEQGFAHRHELAECLEEAGVGRHELAEVGGDNGRGKGGLVTLARALAEEDWTDWWRETGDGEAQKKRRRDLHNAFTRLHGSLQNLWPNASFQVYNDSGRGTATGPCRWIDLNPTRLRILD